MIEILLEYSLIIDYMSMLLKDRVWVMLSEVAKRGVYPLHGSRLGIFRIPTELTDHSEIAAVMSGLKAPGFKTDSYADRIYVTYTWDETEVDPVSQKQLSAQLNVTIEIVTGEVIDVIYQIKPIEWFGDLYWVKNYRKKADTNAKMVIDTILWNTKIGDKLLAQYQKSQKLSAEDAIKRLDELTPLKHKPISRSSTPPPAPAPATAAQPSLSTTEKPQAEPAVVVATTSGNTTFSLSGTGTNYSKVEGPIDKDFKSKRQVTGKFEGINVWGPIDPPGQLGVWGTEVCVDFDICVADGACIEACPVNVYEWLETPGHPASEKKPFMIREKDCIFCMACENVCPPQCVKIFQKS